MNPEVLIIEETTKGGCVMRDGRIQKILPADEATEVLIISYALGVREAVR